jgi:hypothetical protein
MANINAPFGFRPITRAGGIAFSVTQYGKAVADPNPIFSFDLVGKITGGIPLPMPEDPTKNLPRIQSGSQLTPGTSLWLGASMGPGAASVGSVHPVTDEIDCVYNAQVSGVTNITTAAHVGLNANVLNTGGNTLTKMSQFQVNGVGIAVTAGLDLRIRQVSTISPNQEGANAIVEVIILKHSLGQNVAGS